MLGPKGLLGGQDSLKTLFENLNESIFILNVFTINIVHLGAHVDSNKAVLENLKISFFLSINSTYWTGTKNA
jgi:hypothetical protein